MPNPVIASKGDSYTIGIKEMEQMATTGVNEFVALRPNTGVDLDKIASQSKSILDKYKSLGKQAAEKSEKDFPGGTEPADVKKVDDSKKVDSDDEKRTKDNIRDESKVERPFDYDKLKSFSNLKSNIMLKLNKVKSLLTATTDRNQKNRLNYIQARLANDLAKIAAMEDGDWKNPKQKQDKDPDGETEKFMKPENTKKEINNLNDMIAKASFEAWSAPEGLKKKAIDDMAVEHKKDFAMAIKVLSENDQEYKKEIEMLETAIGKKSNLVVVSKEEKEEKEVEGDEKEEKEEKPEKKEKKDEKKDDDKSDKKPEKKDDKKDSKDEKSDKGKETGSKDKKSIKESIKERMQKMREKRKSSKPADGAKPPMAGPTKPEMGKPEMKPDMGKDIPGKEDDLTAIMNKTETKAASYWEVKDGNDNTVLKFTGADAFGKDIYKEWNSFSSKDYGTKLLASIREKGFKKVSELVNGKLMKTASDAKSYYTKYFSQASGKAGAYGKMIADRFKGKSAPKKAEVDTEKIKLSAENKQLQAKIDELSSKLNKESKAKENLESEKVLRAKAERALKLANVMLDKKRITAEELEDTTTKLTVMDDLSFSMVEDMTMKGTLGEEVNAGVEKKAFKMKAGLKNVPLITEKIEGFKEKLAGALMSKPKYQNILNYHAEHK